MKKNKSTKNVLVSNQNHNLTTKQLIEENLYGFRPGKQYERTQH